MKRITIEESREFIPCSEDFTGDGLEKAELFTLTPNTLDSKWDDVTYYTKRSTAMYMNRDGDYDSWVYIMSNPASPGYLKIGFTKNTPEERAKQISNSTGVILPMVVEWAFQCYNGFALEQEVHEKLKSYRVNNHREFFQISLGEAKDAVIELGARYLK